EMADLGIAHLAGRQPDILAGGAQEAVRAGGPEPVEGRGFGLADRVIGGVLAPAPSVQYHQHHGAALLHADISRARLKSAALWRIAPASSTRRGRPGSR